MDSSPSSPAFTAADTTDVTPEEPTPTEGVGDVVEESVPEGLESLIVEQGPFFGIITGLVIALLVALVVTVMSSMLLKQIFRHHDGVKQAVNRTRTPLFITLVLIGAWFTLNITLSAATWFQPVSFVLLVAVVIGLAWWALRIVRIVEAMIYSRYIGYSEGELDVEDRRGRRLATQVSLIRRILTAVIITLAVAAILLMIPQVRALGAGLLASAGVASVVVGLAMQSVLTNVFAGIQLAFTDSIRAGDVVVVEGNFGTVEDITLTAVVIKSWDERRFIYPSSYFVATPFENWTRVGTDILGTVELDVDWRVPMDPLRARLKRLLDSAELWDGRDYSLQVTDAVGGMVKARVVVSARNSGELWDLRCLIREDLVNYLRAEHPYAVFTQRMLLTNEEALARSSDPVRTGQVGVVDSGADSQPVTQAGEGASVFTGSIAAVQRNREFSGPGADAYRERLERQEERQDGQELDADGTAYPEDVAATQAIQVPEGEAARAEATQTREVSASQDATEETFGAAAKRRPGTPPRPGSQR
ncbi:mechanosensitive ion channel family protein [Nesterenkonia sandarakina]|uniref:Small-conductance mechanosensitive channel n=1 Tax=Nesterenkonia sandarakina TaxID=272918 RepID=A0A7Z0E8Q4_9MICC|nr:mechanosensitive ion channel domain-containing protein [Nesterenkonia sandarakina]NYJ16690.1 small-conductance mechanosensitive channel [Nesterenkonia sandarakina]